MRNYTTDATESRAVDLLSGEEGTLVLRTTIRIRGNHLKGPVPVTIRHECVFTPDDKYQEFDEDDKEYNRVSYSKDFSKEEERTFYTNNKFQNL